MKVAAAFLLLTLSFALPLPLLLAASVAEPAFTRPEELLAKGFFACERALTGTTARLGLHKSSYSDQALLEAVRDQKALFIGQVTPDHFQRLADRLRIVVWQFKYTEAELQQIFVPGATIFAFDDTVFVTSAGRVVQRIDSEYAKFALGAMGMDATKVNLAWLEKNLAPMSAAYSHLFYRFLAGPHSTWKMRGDAAVGWVQIQPHGLPLHYQLKIIATRQKTILSLTSRNKSHVHAPPQAAFQTLRARAPADTADPLWYLLTKKGEELVRLPGAETASVLYGLHNLGFEFQ